MSKKDAPMMVIRGKAYEAHVQVDPFTGEEFHSRHRHHYEPVDSVPFAPPVEVNRPTIRQRIENLLNRGVDPLANYVGYEGVDLEVPDDPEAPLTASEQNYIDAMAESLAEQAPLPDDGLPRPEPVPPSAVQPATPQAPEAAPAGVSSPPQAPPLDNGGQISTNSIGTVLGDTKWQRVEAPGGGRAMTCHR